MDTLLPPEIVALATRVIEENRTAGRRIAVAESCTGGLVAAALTEVPGASDVFDLGFVTYSNDAKMALLKVSADVLETFGAVSVATAWAMAQGALKHSTADVTVSVTSGHPNCNTNITQIRFSSATGIITFQAMFISWSKRNRGIVQRMTSAKAQ